MPTIGFFHTSLLALCMTNLWPGIGHFFCLLIPNKKAEVLASILTLIDFNTIFFSFFIESFVWLEK